MVRVLAYGVCQPDVHAWAVSDTDAVLPVTCGQEYCGEVIAIGNQVKRWRVGGRAITRFILAGGQCPECAQGQQTACPDQVVSGTTCDGALAGFIPFLAGTPSFRAGRNARADPGRSPLWLDIFRNN